MREGKEKERVWNKQGGKGEVKEKLDGEEWRGRRGRERREAKEETGRRKEGKGRGGEDKGSWVKGRPPLLSDKSNTEQK